MSCRPQLSSKVSKSMTLRVEVFCVFNTSALSTVVGHFKTVPGNSGRSCGLFAPPRTAEISAVMYGDAVAAHKELFHARRPFDFRNYYARLGGLPIKG